MRRRTIDPLVADVTPLSTAVESVSLVTDLLVGAVNSLGPSWGWLALAMWLAWQLYCPLPNHETKLQSAHNDLTTRLNQIEITQIALGEYVDGVDAERIRRLHGAESLSPNDLIETDPPPNSDAE